jgi:hypothetical protein
MSFPALPGGGFMIYDGLAYPEWHGSVSRRMWPIKSLTTKTGRFPASRRYINVMNS